MPTTTPDSLPYPVLTDAPNGPAQFLALATAVQAAFVARAPRRQAYTPTFTSTGTAPTKGTGGTIVGEYSIDGDFCDFAIKLTFGTSPTAGTGNYILTLPFAPAGYGAYLARGYLRQAAGGPYHSGFQSPIDTQSLQFHTVNGSGVDWSQSVYAPANGDIMYASGRFPFQ